MTPERRKQIELLLRCRHDFDPSDVRDSLASLKTTRGPAPSKRVECPDCEGKGIVKRRGIEHGCLKCGGQDYFVTRGSFALDGPLPTNDRGAIPGRGWIEVDDYTGQTVSTLAAPQPERTTTVMCDRCGGSGFDPREDDNRCWLCRGVGVIELPLRSLSLTHSTHSTKANPAGRYEGDRGSEARAKAELNGSFFALGEALSSMRVLYPAWHRALLISLGELEGQVHAPNIESAYVFLDSMLPAQLRVPRYAAEAEARAAKRLKGKGRWANGSTQKDRDEKIRKARQEGESVTMIEIRFGLSRSVVYEIIGKANGDEVAA